MRSRLRRPRFRYLAALVVSVGLVPLADHSPVAVTAFRSAAPPRDGDTDLTVLTFNVNFGAATDPATLVAIEEADADVVILQETTAHFEAIARPALFERYPHQHWQPSPAQWAAGGAAILARVPLSDLRVTPSPGGWFETISALVETTKGPVRVVGVHLEPAVSARALASIGARHRREIEAHLAQLDDPYLVPVVVAGDFNEERGGALRTLREQGFRDAVARYAGGAPTWHWPVGSLTARLQLDHVLYRGPIEALHAEVLDRGASDHRPVKVRFEQRSAVAGEHRVTLGSPGSGGAAIVER